MKSILLLFVGLSFIGSAHALGPNSFLAAASLTGGVGSTSNKDKTVPNISLLQSELALDLGYKFNNIAPILKGSYRFVGQTTKAESVGNINMAGMGYLLGAGFTVEFTRFSFTAVYDLMGQYDLTKKSGGGSKVSYAEPSGFHLDLKYLWRGHWQFVLSGSIIEFKEKIVGSSKTDIGTNPLTQTIYGLGLGYRF